MQHQAGGVRGAGQRRQLRRRVHGAELGGLGDGNGRRLHVVLVADAHHGLADLLWRELAVRGGHVHQLGAGEALRRAALVHVDVRRGRAHHRLPGPQHAAQHGHVAAGAVEHREGLGPRSEQLAKAVLKGQRPGVVAVGRRPARVGRDDGVQNGGVHAGVVVAGEGVEPCVAHGSTPSPRPRRPAPQTCAVWSAASFCLSCS